MRRLARALGALALTLATGGAVALAPGSAEAQGKERKSWQDDDKQARKQDRQWRKQERKQERRRAARLRDDDRRWDDRRRDRGDDGRWYPSDRRVATTGRYRSSRVPPGHLPPPGLCRIWIDGVPPGRQPRPTSCAAAERDRPANARVLHGARTDRDDDRRYDGRDRDGRSDPRPRTPEGSLPRRPVPLPWP